jgi:hypothetical protein
MVPETLDRVPVYPPAGCSRDEGERYLIWRLNLSGFAHIAAGMSGGVKEHLRQTILNDHGESRMMGKGPNGKLETLRDLFERIYNTDLVPKAKRRA